MKTLEQYPFIFSNQFRYRFRRHLTYWIFWWLFQGFLYSFVYLDSRYGYQLLLISSMLESLIFLSMHIFLSYMLIYFVLPRYLLKQKYWHTAAWVFSLFIVTASLSAFLAATVIEWERSWLTNYHYYRRNFNSGTFSLALMAGLRGGITIGGISAAIKLMKYWYTKERRNLQLQKENAESQLQLLKAQVHPHFLFNTLNNIYSFTQNTSAVASKLVMGLSDMLRYMLYECNLPLVPLDKELKMLQDYCVLEQIRYGNQLDLHITLPEHTNDLYIAPLLLLPFVENSFKHGASQILDQPWISLHFSIEGDILKMSLVNGKPPEAGTPAPGKAGIGITNVQKRLALLYPEKHTLSITAEEEVFIINLTVVLEHRAAETSKPLNRPIPQLHD